MTTETVEAIEAHEIITQDVMTEQEAMDLLIEAAQELAWIKYRHFPPGALIPPSIKAELKHHARLLEAAKVAKGLSWWEAPQGGLARPCEKNGTPVNGDA